MAAACKGRLQCCKELLAAGADPTISNLRGYTAVDAAVDAGHAECAAILLQYGAVASSSSLADGGGKECHFAEAGRHRSKWTGRQHTMVTSAAWEDITLPRTTRLCRELDAQLSKHLLAAPEAKLLETPHDRFARVERQHKRQVEREAARSGKQRERETTRSRVLADWHERVDHRSGSRFRGIVA
jgi:hypothetical protein